MEIHIRIMAAAAMLMLAQPLFGYMWTINNNSNQPLQVCQTYKQFPNYDGQNCAVLGPMGTLGPYSVGGYCTVDFILLTQFPDGGWGQVSAGFRPGGLLSPDGLACTGGIVDISLHMDVDHPDQAIGFFVTMTGVGSSPWSTDNEFSTIVVQ